MQEHPPEPSLSAADPGMLTPGLEESYAQLRRVPLFDGIPNDDLWAAISSGGIRRHVIRRDAFVADPANLGSGSNLFFVVDGQLAVGVFDPTKFTLRRQQQDRFDALSEAERRYESALTPPPLARDARKNLAVFVEGDLFNSDALPQQPEAVVAFYTTAPSVIARIDPQRMSDFVLRFPFFEARVRRAIELGRDRLRNVAGVKQEILDFFVRQGLSVAGSMVRVRQLDLCIDCKQCEDACEERYGSKRLSLGGYQLGMLDFVYTCRTCTDQRCVDPCEYDSIWYDKEKQQVVINEATCTGCSLCAQLCPYGSIELVDVEDPQDASYREDYRLRLEADGALKFGPGAPRVARARRIANKCDHCADYSEQACITSCPTGSLIEVDAYDLFRERKPGAAAVARSGYDQEMPKDRRELLPIRPFVNGAKVRQAGIARIKRFRVGAAVVWALGLAAWFLCLAEIMLRLYAPTHSLQYQIELLSSPPAVALLQVGYRAGNELAVWCGYIGTGLMLIAILYPFVRRINAFRFVANARVWFDFHLMSGTVGPMFIVLHSALKLDNWVSAAFWSMIIVAVSGVVGRYLYTQIPDLVNGRELEELDHRRALAKLGGKYPDAVRVARAELEQHEKRASRVADRAGLLGALLWLILEDLRRPGRWVRRRVAMRSVAIPRKPAKEVRRRTSRLIAIDRRRVLGNRAQMVLHSWKKVHVPFSFIMAAISVVHIWVAFQYSM